MFKTAAYHRDPDNDDDFDSETMSPTMPPDFQTSPTSSDGMSTEQTPTYSTSGREGVSPRVKILDWDADRCADFVSEVCGLDQYADAFVDESITGDALVALVHSDLKDMGVNSVGHRMTILKCVYDLKVKHNMPIEADHFVPLSAEADAADKPPTQDDIARIIHIIKDRDAEIRSLREDLVRISEENRKLREDLLPLVRAAKDRSQPLPTPEDVPQQTQTGGLSRKFSNKRIFLQQTTGAKNLSPTTILEGRAITEGLDPSAAALAASSHLTTSMRDGVGSPGYAPDRSPTSPAYRELQPPNSGGPAARPFPRTENSDYGVPLPTPQLSTTSVSTPQTANLNGSLNTPSLSSHSASSTPQVEIFKSFRVSIDDPCHKVLPVALKKYNITADWRQYALYIVHGDQERCLGLNEKPLILFKQLDKDGRKPMFMLRKHAAPAEGTVSVGGGPPQLVSSNGLPGGII